MKNFVSTLIIILISLSTFGQATEYAPYLLLKKANTGIEQELMIVKETLANKGFKVTGEYAPMGNENLYVLTYTSERLEKIALDFEDRGALAATLKVGFKKEGVTVKVSMTNPMYQFYAYFTDKIGKHEEDLENIADKAIATLKSDTELVPFGGTLKKEKLQKYHYKVMMPYFKDADVLNTFSSFEEGLKIIQDNLAKENGKTVKIYELVYPDKKVAVFGIGLLDVDKGEPNFLPKIGDDHVCALPYELILQGNKATSLAGKYRIALHWPELTMGTFMKIMSTPGDIKNALKELTKQ